MHFIKNFISFQTTEKGKYLIDSNKQHMTDENTDKAVNSLFLKIGLKKLTSVSSEEARL